MFINQYIRNHKLKTLWDTTQPHIRSHHERLCDSWIQMAQLYRKCIRQAHRPSHLDQPMVEYEDWNWVTSMSQWIYQNSDRLHQDPKLAMDPADSPCYNDGIMSAYLEWGVKNIPITPRVTEYTLQCLEGRYKGKEMLWSEYIRDVNQIIQYQMDRNRKPFEKMTREELLRWIQQQPESTVRRAVTAVTQ